MPTAILRDSQPFSTAKKEPDNRYVRRFAAREVVMSDSTLSEGARLLYLCLDEYARGADVAFPSQKTLAGRLGMSLRTIERHLKQLREAGVVEAARRSLGGPNEYRLAARDLPPTSRQPPANLPPDLAVPPDSCGGTLPTAVAGGTPQNLHILPHPARAHVFNQRIEEKNISITAEQFAELEEAYERHLKHHRQEPRDIVLQILMDMSNRGALDWDRFRDRHSDWCAAQQRAGWQYCTLTLLAWVRAGMPQAAPIPDRNARHEALNVRPIKPDVSSETSQRAMEEAERMLREFEEAEHSREVSGTSPRAAGAEQIR